MPGIYLHIPFCKQACHYCDFHFSTSVKMKNQFIEALLLEIELRSDYLPKNEIINTIYFGGGTPSLLVQKDLQEIFNALHKQFTIAEDAEITLEANPDDLTKEKLMMLSATPVNRLSIGIQSFDDAELQWMNRVHNSKIAIDCVYEARAAGFKNISVDLIYGSPLLTNKDWITTLETTFRLPVQHLSCYNLTIEEKTTLASMIRKGKTKGPNENNSADQFKILMEMTANNGFEQYEISNFCRNEQYSKHNSSYWKGIHYIGFGPSAHSFNGSSRQWNISNNNTYCKELNSGTPSFVKENLADQELYNEYIMTSLRTKWGVNSNYILEKFGIVFEKYFLDKINSPLIRNNLFNNNQIFTLTSEGKFFADQIAADLFHIDSR